MGETNPNQAYYYAGTAPPRAMIMPRETKREYASDSTIGNWKKDAVEGILDSSTGGLWETIESRLDCRLAGCDALVLTIAGEQDGTPLYHKCISFWNPERKTAGWLVFTQSADVEFDYSQDFAEIVASATRA